MKLDEVIDRCLVAVGVEAETKDGLLVDLVRRIKETYPSTDDGTLLEALRAREKEASTGIGNGVAIPHAAVKGLEKPICMLARLANPMEFDALDHKPVHVVFLLASPLEKASPSGRTLGAKHVRLLARLARLCMNDDFVDRLAATKSDEELFQLVRKKDNKHV